DYAVLLQHYYGDLRLVPSERGFRCEDFPFAEIESLLCRYARKDIHESGNDSRPTGLMARSQSRPVVAMEVLVEQEVVTPMHIRLELLGATIDGTGAVFPA